MNLIEQFEKEIGKHWRSWRNMQPDIEYIHWLESKYHSLLTAAKETLEENLNLCDGEDCTLRKLRDAVSNHSL